jgi:UDP-glucose 4-epimerase
VAEVHAVDTAAVMVAVEVADEAATAAVVADEAVEVVAVTAGDMAVEEEIANKSFFFE